MKIIERLIPGLAKPDTIHFKSIPLSEPLTSEHKKRLEEDADFLRRSAEKDAAQIHIMLHLNQLERHIYFAEGSGEIYILGHRQELDKLIQKLDSLLGVYFELHDETMIRQVQSVTAKLVKAYAQAHQIEYLECTHLGTYHNPNVPEECKGTRILL